MTVATRADGQVSLSEEGNRFTGQSSETQASLRSAMAEEEASASALMKSYAGEEGGGYGGAYYSQIQAQEQMLSALGIEGDPTGTNWGGVTAGAAAGATAGAFLSPVGAAVGGFIGGGLAWLGDAAYESDDESLTSKIKAGSGTFLVGKLRDSGEARRIDEILSAAANSPGDTSAQELERLRVHFGDQSITTDDVEVLKAVLGRTTGLDNPESRLNTSGAYDAVQGLGQTFARIDEARVVREQAIAASSLASDMIPQGLTGEMSAALADFRGLAFVDGQHAGTALVRESSQLAKLAGEQNYRATDTSTFSQLLEQSGSAYREVMGAETFADLDTLMGEENANQLLQMAGVQRSRGSRSLTQDQRSRLAEMQAGGMLASLSAQGAGAEMALMNGMSPVERQNRNIERLTGIIDALYSRASGDNPMTPAGRRIYDALPASP
jgi:hypothetical protein